LAKLDANEIRIKSNASTTIITYNNFDFAKHRFEEQLNKRKTQREITTTLQFVDVCISSVELQQSM